MQIILEKPIAFIDIESTGVSRDTDRIVEISICKLMPDGKRETKTRRVNPGMPIPAAATAIHGITDADVANELPFARIAVGVLNFIQGCDLAGYNSNAFDYPMLYAELLRAGITWDYKAYRMIDMGNIFKIQEPRTLEAAVKFYCNKEHTKAHSAEADVEATVDVFLGQLMRYENVRTMSMNELQLFCNYDKPILDLSGKFTTNESGDIILNFGPKKGLLAKENLDFVQWMYYKAQFPPDTRKICEELLNDFN